MKCPDCKEEITDVEVESKCYQNAFVENGEVVDYSSIKHIGNTIRVNCGNCGADVTKLLNSVNL